MTNFVKDGAGQMPKIVGNYVKKLIKMKNYVKDGARQLPKTSWDFTSLPWFLVHCMIDWSG